MLAKQRNGSIEPEGVQQQELTASLFDQLLLGYQLLLWSSSGSVAALVLMALKETETNFNFEIPFLRVSRVHLKAESTATCN